MITTFRNSLTAITLSACFAPNLMAAVISEENGKTLSFNVEAMAAAFSLDENYSGTPGDRQWQEAYIKGDLAGSSLMDNGSTLYGGLGLIALGTRGDGDGLGLTTGDESDLDIENAYVGWQSSNNLVDLSVGRQMFTLGDGFLIAGDSISPGKGFDSVSSGSLDRGGAYYLAGRKSFDNTAILKVDPDGPVRGDLFWLKSDNQYQQNTELTGVNLEYVDDAMGTLGLSYMKATDVDVGAGLALFDNRDGMDIVSLRGQGSMGVENLFLSFEYVSETGGDQVEKDANAWYVEGGWTFADLPWTPNLNYRHAEFSGDDTSTTDDETFDPLFFGFTRGFGTWFQGEVASNYGGPFNSGNDVDRIELTVSPREDLLVGLQYWDFGPQDNAADNSATEIDLYALWTINDNWVFSPMIGLYEPEGSSNIAAQGNSDDNLYLQAVLMYFY